eukprot:scaffold12806_cov104-Isochrysis_galbana.AAC.9
MRSHSQHAKGGAARTPLCGSSRPNARPDLPGAPTWPAIQPRGTRAASTARCSGASGPGTREPAQLLPPAPPAAPPLTRPAAAGATWALRSAR